jgi:hypothetical protein
MWIGLFLILVGVFVILSNMGVLRGDTWDYIWPVFFILLGASMILKRIRRNDDRVGPPGGFTPPNP